MLNSAICSDCEFFMDEEKEKCPKCGAEMVTFENIGIRKDIHPTMPCEEPLRSFVLQIKEMNFGYFCQSYLKFYKKKKLEKIKEVFERFVKEKPVLDEQSYDKFVARHAIKGIDIDWFIQSACRKYYRHTKFLNQQVISFIPQDIKKEQEIRDRKGWFVELGVTGRFYYPPERIAFYDMDMDERINDAIRLAPKEDNDDTYHIAHMWQEVTKNGVTSIEKTYMNNGNWYFGEAEYQGRKNGAKPWETENRILENIENDIKSALPEREISFYSKTKFGMYDIYVYGIKKEDEDIIEEVIKKYRKKYPKDTFTVLHRFDEP